MTTQADAARQVVKQDLSVRATETLVNKLLAGKKQPSGKPATTDPDIKKLEDDLAEKLGTRVDIKYLRSGKGEVRIKYNSLDELDGILAKIK